uniref:Uncharacterized protein n=1 Tax=Chenopodium quinoa TaxID=63459 RepID=A0A803MAT5_CHEQI
MKMANSFCRQYRDQLSDRCLNWFPCLSDPGRRSSICLKVALVMIHLIYLGVLLIADTDNVIQTAKKNPWYIGLYLLLFVATLIQYFVTSGSSPGYVIDAMRAANEGYSSRVPHINSKQPATSNNGNVVIPVDANTMGRSFLGSNAPPWTQLVMEMYPPGTSTSLLEQSIVMIVISVFFSLTIIVFGLEHALARVDGCNHDSIAHHFVNIFDLSGAFAFISQDSKSENGDGADYNGHFLTDTVFPSFEDSVLWAQNVCRSL